MENTVEINIKTILIIDSDKINQLLLETIFEEYPQYKLIFASNREEVYKIYKANTHFDIVLIEMLLKDIDGYLLMKMIKKARDIPVIALTVCAMKNERLKCFKFGCDAYISKPFIQEILLKTIESFLKIYENKLSVLVS